MRTSSGSQLPGCKSEGGRANLNRWKPNDSKLPVIYLFAYLLVPNFKIKNKLIKNVPFKRQDSRLCMFLKTAISVSLQSFVNMTWHESFMLMFLGAILVVAYKSHGYKKSLAYNY